MMNEKIAKLKSYSIYCGYPNFSNENFQFLQAHVCNVDISPALQGLRNGQNPAWFPYPPLVSRQLLYWARAGIDLYLINLWFIYLSRK